MRGPETFASRWSRLKQEQRDSDETAEAEPQPGPEAVARASDDDVQAGAEQSLPDPETLNRDDDFSAYMAAGVLQALRRRALRRLWALDPVFANIDGLVEYGDDFTAAGKATGSLRASAHAARRLARTLRGSETDTDPSGQAEDAVAEEAGTDEETEEPRRG